MSNLAHAHRTSRPAIAGDHAARPRRRWLGARNLLAAGIAMAAAGCQFNPSGQPGGGLDGGGGGPSDARDAMFSLIDADPGQPDANCAWPFEPEHFDPCGPDKPPQQLFPLVLDLDGTYTYNTDTGLLTNPSSGPVTPVAATQERGVQTIWVASFAIEGGTTLRVEGTKPLMIASTADIRVRGTIDVSSSWNPTTKTFDLGAGSEPIDCSATKPQAGGECIHGGGGGGGGAFSGGGGAGGQGAVGETCDGEAGSPGGSGGRSLTAPPRRIRGGCAGERGGKSDADMLYGLGGAGGGAVHLVSQTRIDIEGSIHAGGAAGAGAENNRSGGGGAGSGGFIGLEAPDIEIDAGAILAANGGGGGGGAENGVAPSGEDGQPSDESASGGPAQGEGGAGGAGSAGGTRNGQPGDDAERGGGGGGGGGAGYILVYRSNPSVDGEAILSPPHAQQ